MVQDEQDEVVYGVSVWPQNQHGAGAIVATKSRNKASSSRLSRRWDPEAKDLWLEAWRGGHALSAGFSMVHHKTTGFLS